MSNWIISQAVELTRGLDGPVFWPRALMVPGDNEAHLWAVEILEGGKPADLTGYRVTAFFERSDRPPTTVMVDGEVEGNIAAVTLKSECYAYEGQLRGLMRIIKDQQSVTVCETYFNIRGKVSDSVVDPGNTIPSLPELLSKIDDMREATEAAEAATGRAQSVVDTYEDTVEAQDAQLIDLRHRADNAEAALGLSAAPGKNLLDPADVVSGQWSTGGTTLNPDAAYISYAHRIPVKGGTTYTLSNDGVAEGKKVATLTEFAADGSRPGISQYWAGTTFTTAATTVELLISLEATWDKPQLEEGSTATAYEPYGDHVTSRMQDEIDAMEADVAGKADRLLYGGIICTYGDSIAASDDGNRSTKTWIDYAAEQLGCARAYNRGVGSTTVTAVTKDGTPRTGYAYVDAEGDAGEVRGMYTTPRTFADYPNAVTPWMCTEQRISTIPEDTDAVVIIAGTNDVGTTTVDGFAAAYGQMLTLMAQLRPAMRIYTCTLPFQQTYDMGSAADVAAYNAYRDAIRRVSAEHGVPCIDLLQRMGVNADNYGDYMSDATHYNTAAGRRLIARCVCDAILSDCGYADAAGYAVRAQAAADAETVQGEDVLAHLARTAPCIACELSGALVSIEDAAARPVERLVSRIEAAQAGTGDPSPENVRAITGWDAATLTRTGKNLIDIPEVTTTRYDVVIAASGNRITMNGTSSAATAGVAVLHKMPIKAGRYMLSGAVTGSLSAIDNTTTVIARASRDIGGTVDVIEARLRHNTVSQISLVVPYDGYVAVQVMIASNSAVYDAYTIDIQLEAGDTATSIIPPVGHATLTASLPETIYGGMLDWMTGMLTVTHKYLQLDGSEGRWTTEGTNSPYYALTISSYGDVVNGNSVCSHFPPAVITSSNTTQGHYVTSSEGYKDARLLIRPDMTVYGTLDAWKTYLAEQAAAGTPVQIVYQLTAPYTIQLTPRQLDLLKGSNHLWSDCGGTDVTYIADTKLYIDHRIAAIAAAVINA